MASDVCESVEDGFVIASLSPMSRLFCVAGNLEILHAFTYLHVLTTGKFLSLQLRGSWILVMKNIMMALCPSREDTITASW